MYIYVYIHIYIYTYLGIDPAPYQINPVENKQTCHA